jgi:hypothetical protein
MSKPFWVQVYDERAGEVRLQRQMTKEEWKEDKDALHFAQLAFDCGDEVPLFDHEESEYTADVAVTFYRYKRDVGSVCCWSSHNFYFAKG